MLSMKIIIIILKSCQYLYFLKRSKTKIEYSTTNHASHSKNSIYMNKRIYVAIACFCSL